MVDIGDLISAELVGLSPSHSGKLVFACVVCIDCDGLLGTIVGCGTDDKD